VGLGCDSQVGCVKALRRRTTLALITQSEQNCV
jgi:hypothetical protein